MLKTFVAILWAWFVQFFVGLGWLGIVMHGTLLGGLKGTLLEARNLSISTLVFQASEFLPKKKKKKLRKDNMDILQSCGFLLSTIVANIWICLWQNLILTLVISFFCCFYSTLRRWRKGQVVESWEAHKSPIQTVIKLPSGEVATGILLASFQLSIIYCKTVLGYRVHCSSLCFDLLKTLFSITI